jgi:peroxiredoxin
MATAPLFTRALGRLVVVLAACSMLVASTARGDEPKIDPQAKKIVDAFGKYYAGLKGFRVSVSVALQVEQLGKKQSQTFDQKFFAERPNKFFYSLASAAGGATVVSDGKVMSLYIKGFNKYASEPAPATFAAIFQNQLVQGTIGLGNASNVVIAMLSNDPAKKLLEKVESVEYGGLVDLEGGVKCHLLNAKGGEMDWQIWIDAGDKSLVRQFIPNLEQALAKLAKGKDQKSPFANMKITNTVSYKDWEVDPKFGPDDFAFHAPEDAKPVGSFMEIITSGMKPREPEPHALLGKPAPPIELELLDGGKLDLASLKDKVVILDFWATWCGPCVQAMPIIDKVAEKFKDQGVLLYAVNLEEGAEEIKKFLEENKLEVPIALDSDGAVAKAYLAVAIPQTVLVGKDGSVQVVKVGLLPDLEASLTKDLESLLAGKNLAAETLDAAKKKPDAKPAAEDKDADAEGDKKATKKP